ncbi:MAG: hypothetical protein GY703_12100, partial [Gammaproteobacteria bacterium]|nr:hypothetical protein [Gammaproteobacteria bacterium]
GSATVSYRLTLTVNSQFQVAGSTAIYTQTHAEEIPPPPVWIGPNINNASVAQGQEFVGPTPAIPARWTGVAIEWSLGGTWPADLAINPSTGDIEGTVTDAVASYSGLTVIATNGGGSVPSNEFDVEVLSDVEAPVWGVVADQVYREGEPAAVAMSNHLTAGTTPMTFAIIAGALPQTFTLDTTTGIISGTGTES